MYTDQIKPEIEALKKTVQEEVFVRAGDEAILDPRTGLAQEEGWLFDFRRVFLKGDVLSTVNTIFWETFKDRFPFQIGGLEVAAIPLVTSFTLKGYQEGATDISSFFIRKSRKKSDLMRMVEGTITDNRDIILVDDLLNTGGTFMRQIKVLEELGYQVKAIWTVLRFRDISYYKEFTDKGIEIHSLFTLDDFSNVLSIQNITDKEPEPIPMPYHVEWTFKSNNPNFFYVLPKSRPALDKDKLYFGADNGYFWAINQSDGSTAWSYKVGIHAGGKSIFSSPVVIQDTVFFGAYDGNVYALDAQTGKKKWMYFDADWIGSSPAYAEDTDTLFVGLEFGLLRKRGGIVALDAQTGKKKWWYKDMPSLTHSSPLYIKEHQQVIIGSNDGVAYLFDANTGKLIWKYETGTPTEEELDAGFSDYDIKNSFVYDKKRDYIMFGNIKDALHIINRTTGEKVYVHDTLFGTFATPIVHKDSVIFSSLDKHLYSVNLDTFEENWKWCAGARIFASPVIIEGSIYIGANTGRMTEIDPETGKERSLIVVPERITNAVVYNPETKRYFLPTFANEIYCLTKDQTK